MSNLMLTFLKLKKFEKSACIYDSSVIIYTSLVR